MKMKLVVAGIVSCLCIIGFHPLRAQDATETDTAKKTFKQLLKANRFPISFDKKGLTGEGGQWLRERAKDAAIVTLGESHASQEIPAMMTALIKDMQEANEFDHLAIEVSPWTAEFMTKQLLHGKKSYNQFIKKYPTAVPFYNFKNERDLLYQIVQETNSERPIWGLDQIFVLSTSLALDRLEQLAPSEKAKSAIQQLRIESQSKTPENPKLKSLPPAFPPPITILKSATYDSLRIHFNGVDEAQKIIDELEISGQMYRLYYTNNYKANQVRARYLRNNLRDAVQQSQGESRANPQVVIKIGGAHAYRGYTPNNTLDVGNLSVALARAMGGEAFNVAFYCGPDSKMSKFPAKISDCWPSQLGEVFKSLSKERAVVFNFANIHQKLDKGELDLNEEAEKFIWGFDALVLIPKTKPAEQIAPINTVKK